MSDSSTAASPPQKAPSRNGNRSRRKSATFPISQGSARVGEPELPIIQQPEAFWRTLTSEDRLKYVLHLEAFYKNVAEEFLHEANSSVEHYVQLTKSHRKWRLWLTVLTGGLAIMNVVIAYISTFDDQQHPFLGDLGITLPLFAAVYAAALAVLSNVEGFNKYAERAQAFREARELFLDAYREFEMLWQIHVPPDRGDSECCINAARLYQRIVARDRQLRTQVRELTERAQGPDPGVQKS